MEFKHGFYMYRVFISAPGDLTVDRDVCLAALAAVNEAEAMPARILLVSLGLPYDHQIVSVRSAVADNIRTASFFVQIFEDEWGPKNLFRRMFYLACECREDAGMPMREIVVCLKAAPREADAEILQFREELERTPNVQLVRYEKPEDLKEKLLDTFTGWTRAARAELARFVAGGEQV